MYVRALWAIQILLCAALTSCTVHVTNVNSLDALQIATRQSALDDSDRHGEGDSERFTHRLCTQYATPRELGRVEDVRIEELSGLAASRTNRGVLWAVNDSGSPKIYAFKTNGERLGAIHLQGVLTLNWEALGIGRCGHRECLYIGDIGDDYGVRPWKTIYRVIEPKLDRRIGDTEEAPNYRPFDIFFAEWERFRFVYPGAPSMSTLVDAEAMAIHPNGYAMIATKPPPGHPTAVYAVELIRNASVIEAQELYRLPWLAGLEQRITGMDIHPSGSTMLLRSNGRVPPLGRAFEATLNATGARTHRVQSVRDVPVANEPQGEAIAYDTVAGGYYSITELNGEHHAPIHYAGCADPAREPLRTHGVPLEKHRTGD